MKQLTQPLKAALALDDPRIAMYQLIHIIGSTIIIISTTLSNAFEANWEQNDFRNKAPALLLSAS